MNKRFFKGFVLTATLCLTTLSQAASILPTPIQANVAINQTITVQRQVVLDGVGPAASKIDVYFLADNTGSMGGAISNVKNNAQTILGSIAGDDARFTGIDIAFGVASYNGDPREFGGSAEQKIANALKLLQPVTKSKVDTQLAINQWRASGGGDGPEGNFFALHQLATNGGTTDGIGANDSTLSSGYNFGWRENAVKLVVWFGDYSSHTTTVDQEEVIAALVENNIIVAAINTSSKNNGIDSYAQAQSIVDATGGYIAHNVRAASATVDAILNSVQTATDRVDLTLEAVNVPSGVTVTYECASASGCDDVSVGETREFNMTITGQVAGSYTFETIVPYLNQVTSSDSVRVRTCLSGLSARGSRSKISVTWADTGTDSYNVYRATEASGPYSLIGTTTNRYSTYGDRDVVAGTTYYYQVKEVDGSGQEFCESNIASVTTASRFNPGPINQPPIISSVPDLGVLEDVQYSYAVLASDPEGSALTYTLSQAPLGMAIDSLGVVSWTPVNNQVGTHFVSVMVSDDEGLSATQLFTLTVTNTNDAPSIVSAPAASIRVGETYIYAVQASDVDFGDTLTFGLLSGPSTMVIDSTTGLISWSPLYGDGPVQTVTLQVSDLQGATDTQVFDILVEEPNRAPSVVSTPLLTATSLSLYQYDVDATDPDVGDTLRYTLLTPVLGMTLDQNTGLINWTPTRNQIGVFNIAVQVEDASLAVDVQNFDITVVRDNVAPVVTSTPPATVEANTNFIYNVIAVDGDGDALSWSLVTAPTGMAIDSSGVLTWLPTESDIGLHPISVMVDDGNSGRAIQSFDLDVLPIPNVAPTISSSPVTIAIRDLTYAYTVIATDPEADVLNFTLSQGATFLTINSANGVLTGTPSLTDVGDYPIEIRVSDGANTVTQLFMLTVLSEPIGNTAPVILSTPDFNVLEGDAWSYQVVSSDAQNDPTTTQLLDSPVGMQLQGDLVSWVTPVNLPGDYAVEIMVSDRWGASINQSFTLRVDANQAPVISSVPTSTVVAGNEYLYLVQAVDPEGRPLTYSLIGAPINSSIDSTGLIRWATGLGSEGVYSFDVRVTDHLNVATIQTINVTVTPAITNSAPVVLSSPPLTATTGIEYSYNISASDADGDQLVFSLQASPSGMSLNALTGEIRWTPTLSDLGTKAVSIEIEDGNGGVALQNFSIAVSEPPNSPPTIDSAAKTTGVLAIDYRYQIVANDIDGDTLQFTLVNGPVGMSMSPSGELLWPSAAVALGDWSVHIEVSDGKDAVSQSFTLTITEPVVGSIGVTLSATLVDPGELVNISVVTQNLPAAIVTLAVNGSDLPLNNSGSADYVAATAGVFVFEAQAISNGQLFTETATLRVRDLADTTAPLVSIMSPNEGADITTIMDIVGTVNDANLYKYSVLVSPVGLANGSRVGEGFSNRNGEVLASLDPSLFKNGMYTVSVEAEDLNGLSNADSVTILIKGEFKPGAVQLSFVDMTIPVAGIPVVVERTYDSRVKTSRDLGIGWDLSVRQGKYVNNIEPGDGWSVASSGGFFKIPCYTSAEQTHHVTEVRISEAESYEFKPRVSLSGYGSVISGGCLGQADFVQTGGLAGAKLQIIGNNNVFYLNGQNLFTYDLGDPLFGYPWEPSNVRLTTPDGRVFDLNIATGISRIEDLNNNQLFISNNGVVNASGVGVSFTRDANGRIVQVQDPAGATVEYSYDALNNLVSFTNQVSETTTYEYHPAPFEHHLQSIVLPDGRVISEFDYNADGRLSEVCNESGCSTAEYDIAGRTQKNYDATGRSITYLYDVDGNVIASTDDMGNSTTFTYDGDGNLIEIVDAEGYVTTQSWDANGNLLSRTEPYELGDNPADFTTQYTWDLQNRLTSVINANGGANVYEYDSNGNLNRITDETGYELSARSYDAVGNIVSESDVYGSQAYSYNAQGMITAMSADGVEVATFAQDAVGNITSFTHLGQTSTQTFDAMGRVDVASYEGVSIDFDYGYGQEWTSVEADTIPRLERTFSAEGKPLKMVNADGSVDSWQYDPAGRVISEVNSLGGVTSYKYDAAGRLIEETDPELLVTSYELDKNGRTKAVVYPSSYRKEMLYYPDGRLKNVTDGSGRQWQMTYTPNSVSVIDELGRSVISRTNKHGLLAEVENADGSTRSWTFLTEHASLDGGEHPLSYTDEAGRTRQYSYDSQGRLIAASDYSLHEATYAYGPFGMTSMTNAMGEVINLDYEPTGEVSSLTFADGSFKNYQRDLQRRIQRVELASGRSKTFSYDVMGRVTEEVHSTGELRKFNYSAASVLQSTLDSLGVSEYDYRLNGQVSEFRSSVGATVEYSYDSAGRVAQKHIKNGIETLTTDYSYDGAGRLTSVRDYNFNLTVMSYDRVGRLTTIALPNGVESRYVYDDRDNVLSVTHVNSANVILRSVSYNRNLGGEPNRITWEDGSFMEVDYDVNVRVSEERYYNNVGALQKRIAYQYNLAGIRTAKVVDGIVSNYVLGSGGRLVAVNGPQALNLGYSLDGQTTSISGSSGLTNITYNFDGQIADINRASNNVSIEYDARGTRAAVTKNGVQRKYLRMPSVSGQLENPQAVLDSSNNIRHTFNYVGDVPLQRIDGTQSTYYLTDGMGSVIGLVDDAGNLVGSQNYDAFGEVLHSTGNMTISDDLGGDFRFHGQWLDVATGYYYMRARDYDPQTGRFLTADPAEPSLLEPESLNRYQFANANPLVNSDPSGRFTLVSVNISINIQATLRSIAINIARDYLIDKARSVAGSMVLSAVKNFTATTGFNPWSIAGVSNPADAGRAWEGKIQSFICSAVPNVLRDVVWFEPTIYNGKASSNGYGCPGGGGSFAPRGSSKPDFMLSKTPPSELGDRDHKRIKAYLIGETKLSLATYYKAYKAGGYNRNQFKQIVHFAKDRVYSRTAVFLALYAGNTTQRNGLSALLNLEAIPKGVIPIMVSAF